MINQLIQIIDKEALVFEEFLHLLDRQKEALLANDTDLLNQVTGLQQQKLNESQVLNRQREEVIARLKEANALQGDVTVTRLLELADEDQSQRLVALRQAIYDLDEKVAEARNTNAMLLNRSREFISRTMTMLAKLNNPENTYSKNGVTSQSQTVLAVDRRA